MGLAAAAPLVCPSGYEEPGYTLDLVVKAAAVVYAGGVVSVEAATGHIRPYVTDSGDKLAGIALATVTGNGTLTCKVLCGANVPVTLSGAAATDVGSLIYASADDAFSTTASTNVRFGTIVKYLGTNSVLVAMAAFGSTEEA